MGEQQNKFIEDNLRLREDEIVSNAAGQNFTPSDWIQIHRTIRSDKRAQTLRTAARKMMLAGVGSREVAQEVIAYVIERRLKVENITTYAAWLTEKDVSALRQNPWFARLVKQEHIKAKRKQEK